MTTQSHRFFLAPMEGVFDPASRELFTELGGLSLAFTEFVRVTERLLTAKVFYHYCPELKTGGRTRSGTPVHIQLLGSDPAVLTENAVFAAELGSLGIDLNFGCPAKTVNRHDGGATLLKNPDRIFRILSSIRNHLPKEKPLSAKVRLGFEDKTLYAEIARAAEEGGADWLTVHARTKTEGYRPPAHWEYIARMKELVDIPVVANGDIWSPEDFQRCLKITGCKDFALGRGLFARPDLPLILLEAKADDKTESWEKILAHLLGRFIVLSTRQAGERFALTRLKQWVKFLGRNFPEAKELFEKIKTCQTLQDAQFLIRKSQQISKQSGLAPDLKTCHSENPNHERN